MQTMKELIETTATLLQREDILDEILEREEESIEPENLEPESRDLKLLIEIANLVIREVAEEYSPTYAIEKVGSNTNSEILLSLFSKQFLKALWVKNANGDKETFNTYSSFVKVSKPNRMFEVCYQYQPQKRSLDENIELSAETSTRVLAYGVASEFCLTELLFDEAIMWDTRFKSSIQNAIRKTKERKVAERRFI